jgi:hypothetical protein
LAIDKTQPLLCHKNPGEPLSNPRITRYVDRSTPKNPKMPTAILQVTEVIFQTTQAIEYATNKQKKNTTQIETATSNKVQNKKVFMVHLF